MSITSTNLSRSLQEGLIEKEARLEQLIVSLQCTNNEIRNLKVQNEQAERLHMSAAQEVHESKILEDAEEKEMNQHSVGLQSREYYSKQIKILDKKKSEVEEEIMQLQNELREMRTYSKSQEEVELVRIRELLKNLQNSLERKVCTPGENSADATQLLERLIHLTNEREGAIRAVATRERLRNRITLLKRRETENLQRMGVCGPHYECNSGKSFLQLRDKYLSEAYALREANAHLSHLVRNTKLSRDGACDRTSALPRDEAMKSSTTPDKACEELRRKIAAASEKKIHLQQRLSQLQEDRQNNGRYESTDSKVSENNVKLLNRELNLARMNLKDVETLSSSS